MSASAPTMKTFHKRLYTVLPRGVTQAAASTSSQGRLRSNSASASVSSPRSFYTAAPSPASSLSGFFDSPAPPSPARPQLTTSRLPIEAKAEVEGPPSPTHSPHGQQSSHSSSSHGPAPPSSIALTPPPPNGHAPFPGIPANSPFFPYPPFTPPPAPATAAPLDGLAHHPSSSKRAARHKYHFDVGAYGIPKRSRSVVSGRDGRGGYGSPPARWTAPSPATDALDLAVQVGEDAYFVRENAMGVADGVGGWSRSLAPHLGPTDPSPSALFARRLMHFCSAEIASLSAPSPPPPQPQPQAQPRTRPHPAPVPAPHFHGLAPWFAPPLAREDPFLSAVTEEEDEHEREAGGVEELQEGLDVLLILERAYARTLEAHVARPPSPPAFCAPPTPPPEKGRDACMERRRHRDRKDVDREKWMDGRKEREREREKDRTVPLMTGSSTALLAVLDSAGAGPRPHPVPEMSAADGADAALRCDAVLRIAHLGDCMGMLVRGEEIVWRSDEMWWSFNTPLQLGPASRTPPASAQLLSLPVCADDILILASDGLSDNLWDEDVLDEVVRFRRAHAASSTPAPAPTASTSADPAASTSAALGAGMSLGLGRRTLAGMLSEALCSRARTVSERRASRPASPGSEVPFARRAREEGRAFGGGKADDISVLVAVISPAEETPTAAQGVGEA